MKILVLGSTGMIGSSIFTQSILNTKFTTFGTYKDKKKINFLNKKKLMYFNVYKKEKFKKILEKIKPNIVINCIGLTKHINKINKKNFIQVNSKFPHYAKKISNKYKIKFVQISTDCVFDGKRGKYKENTKPNAKDIYGLSKSKGEINDNFNLTIRTSTIGHEINTKYGLLEWFLSQKKSCQGYKSAYFNGLPTYYLSNILLKILSEYNLSGLIHISGVKISKYDLLKKINKIYNKNIKINPNDTIKIDRTLDNSKIKKLIKYSPNWNQLILNKKKYNEKR